jgi:hypothetical protein
LYVLTPTVEDFNEKLYNELKNWVKDHPEKELKSIDSMFTIIEISNYLQDKGFVTKGVKLNALSLTNTLVY